MHDADWSFVWWNLICFNLVVAERYKKNENWIKGWKSSCIFFFSNLALREMWHDLPTRPLNTMGLEISTHRLMQKQNANFLCVRWNILEYHINKKVWNWCSKIVDLEFISDFYCILILIRIGFRIFFLLLIYLKCSYQNC